MNFYIYVKESIPSLRKINAKQNRVADTAEQYEISDNAAIAVM